MAIIDFQVNPSEIIVVQEINSNENYAKGMAIMAKYI